MSFPLSLVTNRHLRLHSPRLHLIVVPGRPGSPGAEVTSRTGSDRHASGDHVCFDMTRIVSGARITAGSHGSWLPENGIRLSDEDTMTQQALAGQPDKPEYMLLDQRTKTPRIQLIVRRPARGHLPSRHQGHPLQRVRQAAQLY